MATLKNTIVDSTGFLKYPVGTDAQRPVSPTAGMTRFNTDRGCLETYNGSAWVSAIVLETAEPNIIAYTAGSHTFTVPQHVSELEVLVIGGGGAGGGRSGGGGGAGGLVYSYNYPVRPGDAIPLTIGAGGAANSSIGDSGSNSTFGPITAYGGGRGGNDSPATGDPGGSGGGSHYGVYGQSTATQTSFAPVNSAGYGNRGSVGYHAPQHNSGGGGGAGGLPPSNGPASNAIPTTVSGGAGGSGRYYEGFRNFGRSGGWFAGGGAGGGHPDGPVNTSTGGRGGGGTTQSTPYANHYMTFNGENNTGGGGGGAQQEYAGSGAGRGGPGVVLIRY